MYLFWCRHKWEDAGFHSVFFFFSRIGAASIDINCLDGFIWLKSLKSMHINALYCMWFISLYANHIQARGNNTNNKMLHGFCRAKNLMARSTTLIWNINRKNQESTNLMLMYSTYPWQSVFEKNKSSCIHSNSKCRIRISNWISFI